MFDLTSSKLLILGVVALIVVGPKELPFLLRTIGKYVGMIRRHANEFRAQFDEAMREAELESIKKEVESVARDAETTLRDAQTSVELDVHSTAHELDQSIKGADAVHASTTDAAAAEAEPHTFDPLNGLDTGATPATPVAAAAASETPVALEPAHQPVEHAPVLAKTGTCGPCKIWQQRPRTAWRATCVQATMKSRRRKRR